MQTNIIISGTGGQGILAAADFLSEALFHNGFHVVGTRSYGAEARGGSAQSVVIASDKEIYDIQFEASDAMLVLSLPAYRKYIGVARKGSMVIVDSRVLSRLKPEEVRKDVDTVAIPAADLAEVDDSAGVDRHDGRALIGHQVGLHVDQKPLGRVRRAD